MTIFHLISLYMLISLIIWRRGYTFFDETGIVYLLWSEFSFVQNYFIYVLWIQFLLPPISVLGSPFLHIFVDFFFIKSTYLSAKNEHAKIVKEKKEKSKICYLACPFSSAGEIDRDENK